MFSVILSQPRETGLLIPSNLESNAGLIARYRGYWLQYANTDEGNRLEQSLVVGIRWLLQDTDVEWTVVGESGLRNYEQDFWRYGTRAEVAHALSSDLIVWISSEIGEDSFPEAKIFDGMYLLSSVGLEHYLSRVTLYWDVYAQWHDAEEAFLESVEYGGGVSASFPITSRISGGAGARLVRLEFDERDILFGGRREDTVGSGRLWLNLPVAKHLTLVPSIEVVSSNSNVDFADYDEFVAGLDLVWSRW